MGVAVYHFCPARAWNEARRRGRLSRPTEGGGGGFLHFSTADQLATSLALHGGDRDDLVLLEVPVEAMGASFVFERSRGGALFPHLYADLPAAAVRRTAPLPRRNGRYVLPDWVGGAE